MLAEVSRHSMRWSAHVFQIETVAYKPFSTQGTIYQSEACLSSLPDFSFHNQPFNWLNLKGMECEH